MDIHYGHHGNETSREAVLSIHECHSGDFFHHLRELTPDCGVSIRTSRTICRFMNIHYGNHGNDMHRLFLWQPFTLTQNIPARQLVPKAFEIGRISSGALLEKNYMYPFFLLKSSFQQSRCMYSVFRHVCQVCPLINIASY